MKTFLLLSYLLFYRSASADMSDHQKRTFLENLALPSSEKRTFYRWQSQQAKKNLLEAGEMTPNLYQYYMNIHDSWAGSGMYVSEDIVSSAQFGSSIIQVEIEPGQKYLNLLDQEVQKKLNSAGITNEDVYKLNPRVIISDVKEDLPYWVIKNSKGVAFKTFSPVGIPVNDLAIIHELSKSPQLNLSILKEVFRRAKEDLSSVVGSAFMDILERKYDKQSLRDAVYRRTRSVKNIEDLTKLIEYAKKYLPQEEITRQSLALVQTSQNGNDILRWIGLHLQPSARKKIINKSIALIETSKDGVGLLQWAGQYLDPSEQKEIIRKSIPLITTSEEGIAFFRWSGRTYLEPSEQKKIIHKSIALIKTPKDGAIILQWAGQYLDPSEQKEIIRKTIPLIRTPEDTSTFLRFSGKHLNSLERMQLIEKAIALVKTTQDGVNFLARSSDHMDDSEIKRIIHKSIHLIKTPKDGSHFLRWASEYLNPSERQEILSKTIALVKTQEDVSDFLTVTGKHLEPHEKKQITTKARLVCLKKQLSTLHSKANNIGSMK